MMSIKSFVVVGLVAFALAEAAYIDKKDDHDKFFKKLDEREQRALIALAISHHDIPDLGDSIVVPGNYSVTFPITPLLKPKAEEIPATLFTAMMNGEVPKKWMKEFIKWVQKDLKVTTVSLDMFRSLEDVEIVCQADNVTCYNINDLGQNCCPFG